MRHARLGVGFGFAGVSGPWSPLNLPGLMAWYVADDGAYNDAGSTLATDGQTVQEWHDQSGNNYHLSQSNSTNRPIFSATGYNGGPGIEFDVTRNLITADDVVALGGTTLCGFTAVNIIENDTSRRLMSFQASDDVTDWQATPSGVIAMGGSATTVTGYRNGAKSSATVSENTNVRVGGIFDGTDHTIYVDGVAGTPVGSTGTFGSTGEILVGANLYGTIKAIIITSTVPSSGNLAAIDAYLASL